MYPSSQALLNDFLAASRFAENIRRNKELPESQRKPVRDLIPPAAAWSTRGDQASPDLAPAMAHTQPQSDLFTGISGELLTIMHANSERALTPNPVSAAASSSGPMPQPMDIQPPQTVTTLANVPDTYHPLLPQLYSSDASPYRPDAVPASSCGTFPVPDGSPRVHGLTF